MMWPRQVLQIRRIDAVFIPRFNFCYEVVADPHDPQWVDLRKWCREKFGNDPPTIARCYWPETTKAFLVHTADAALLEMTWFDPNDRPPPYPRDYDP